MGLDKVVEEIKENAQKEAEGILEEARKQADSIIKQSREKVSESRKEMERESKQLIKQIESRNITIRKTRKRELLLKTKKEIMDGIYERFLEELKNSKGKEKEKVYKRLASLAKNQMKNPRKVYVNPNDFSVVRKVYKGVHAEKKEMNGGFMLESEDGREFVDFRFETLVELLKERTLKNLSKILFGG